MNKSLESMGESPIERRVMIRMMYEFGEKIGEEYEDDVWYVLLQVEGTDKYVLEWRESLTMELRIIGIFTLKDLIISALFINEALTEKEFSPLEDEMIERIMGQAVEVYWHRVYPQNEDWECERIEEGEIGMMTTDDLESSQSTIKDEGEELSDVTDTFHSGFERQADSIGALRDMHIWTRNDRCHESEAIPNYHRIIESAVKDVRHRVEMNLKENAEVEQHQFRRVLEATDIFLSHENWQIFVEDMVENWERQESILEGHL